jgi:hypothetical protein
MAGAKAEREERKRQWTERVSKWQDSGLSQVAFCRKYGLNGNTFNYWKLRVLKQRPGARRLRRTLEPKSGESAGKVEFTPVRVIDAPACTYEVCLRGGRSIRITSNFDEASLRRLIGVLDGATGAC